ncbi:GAF domain-containing protein [Nocardia sp. CA-120079]|uniref:GAF domain-containing protein n=1 Tax=Nocardia sp. CA-120079 TaxID=3239974 RepID=UPI003D969011
MSNIAERFALEDVDDLGPDEFTGRAVRAFEEVALLASSDVTPVDDVLRLAGQRLCELIGATRFSVYLRAEDGRLHGRVGCCEGRRIDGAVSKLVSSWPENRLTAEIVASSAPVVVADATEDPLIVQRARRRWGSSDMLGVPLVFDGEVIGVIFVDNDDQKRTYSQHDVKLAQTFARLCALAVQQAWLYRQLGERVKVIDDQRKVLGTSAKVHNLVTRAVLDGRDIPQTLELVARLLGKPVVLYSAELRVTEWAAPERSTVRRCPGLTAEQLELAWVRASIASLQNGSSSVVLHAGPDTRWRRLLVRLAVGERCAGYLELCEVGHPFSAVDAKSLEEASMAIALKLVIDERNADRERREREECFVEMLHPRRDAESLAQYAERLGIDLERRHVVLRLQYPRNSGRTYSLVHHREDLLAVLDRLLDGAGRAFTGTAVPGADLLLLEVPVDELGASDGRLTTALRRALPNLVDHFGVQHVVVSDASCSLVAIAGMANRVEDIALLLSEANTPPRVVIERDLALARLVTRREGMAGAAAFAEELLSPLREYDRATGGALLQTLVAFTRSQGQIRATAAALVVHENTVRYRLNRIRELSAIEPERLDSLMNVALALQLQELAAAL